MCPCFEREEFSVAFGKQRNVWFGIASHRENSETLESGQSRHNTLVSQAIAAFKTADPIHVANRFADVATGQVFACMEGWDVSCS